MTKIKKQRYFLVAGFMLMFGLILFSGLADAISEGLSSGVSDVVWTSILTDTFDTLSPAWTIIDDTNDLYRWDVTPYTRDVGSLVVADYGLWSAGGGTVGSTQSWPTGTYANNMTTWAIAGPFTPTQKVWEMRLRAEVQNRIVPGDSLFVGLSGDGITFDGLLLTDPITTWQEVTWTTKTLVDAPVWIGLRFVSDGQNVDAGSLVDNLALEFNLGTETYLPLVRRDPTPTPTPTPTPLPVYVDQFDDPDSGWYVGEAIRYNEWCRWGWDCHAGDEEVAYMSYVQGNYSIDVPVSWQGGAGDVDTWFVWPAQAAPLPDALSPLPERYCVEVRGKIANSWADYQPWWAHWGIIFGANADMTELYTFQVNANHNYSAFRIHNYEYPGNHQPLNGEEINVEIPIVPWCVDEEGYPCDLPLIPTATYNTLKVAVKGNVVDLYVNGVKLDFGDVIGMPRAKIGLIGGSWEVTPVEIKIDYFRFDALCPEVQ